MMFSLNFILVFVLLNHKKLRKFFFKGWWDVMVSTNFLPYSLWCIGLLSHLSLLILLLLKLSRHTRTRKTKRFHFENSWLEEGRKCLQSLDGDVQRERERWPSLNCTLFRVGKPPNFTTWSWRAVLEAKGQSILVTWWWFQTLATSKRQRTWGKRGIWWRNFLTRTLLDHNTEKNGLSSED